MWVTQMEEMQEKLRGTEDLHDSASLRMSSDSLDFPAAKPTRSFSNQKCFEPNHFLSTVSLTRLDCEPVNTPDYFTTLSCPDLLFEIERVPQPFHLRLPSTDHISDSQETLKADDDDDSERFFENQQHSFYLNSEQEAEDILQVEEVNLSAINKLKSFEDCSSSSSTTYVTCSETSLFSATQSRPTSLVRSNDSLQFEGHGSSNSSLAYFTPLENTPVSSKCTSPVPTNSMQRKILKLSLAHARRQNEQQTRSSSTPSSPVPSKGNMEQTCHTLPRVAKKHRIPSPQSKPYSEDRTHTFSVDAAALFPLEPRTLHYSSIPSQLHTADSFEELQEFLLLESQCVVERKEKSESD